MPEQIAMTDEQFKKFMKTAELSQKMAFSVEECSVLLPLSERTIRSLIQNGEFPSLRIGGRLVISRSALTAWLDRNSVRD